MITFDANHIDRQMLLIGMVFRLVANGARLEFDGRSLRQNAQSASFANIQNWPSLPISSIIGRLTVPPPSAYIAHVAWDNVGTKWRGQSRN